MSQLIAIKAIQAEVPSWPFTRANTYRLIRLGRLRHVKVGRSVFVTRELLEQFVADHTVQP